MKIVWMTWKDRMHPLAGGAEVVNEELAKRLVADGHTVTFLVGSFAGAKPEEKKDGYTIIRLGSRYSVYWQAYQYYKKHFQGQVDLVIDEINTIPFFAGIYAKEKTILFIHQLAREIWFYEMIFPLSLIGYLLEPIYLWLLRHHSVITISESSKRDIARFGFKKENIHIISEGIELEPVENVEAIEKFSEPTLLSLGSIRSMKRTSHIIKAFKIAKDTLPALKLIVAGDASGRYGKKVLNQIERSKYKTSISYLGKVDKAAKIASMRKSHLIAVTSVKEGWGLIVTEAASQGTPAVVYDVDGLRDSVKNRETGIVATANTPASLASAIVTALSDSTIYHKLRRNAWEWSASITFEKAYQDFLTIVKNVNLF